MDIVAKVMDFLEQGEYEKAYELMEQFDEYHEDMFFKMRGL